MPSPSVALLRTQSDDRLVGLAAAGHERAFEAIVERYRRQLLRHARRYLPEARAEDALQQALMSAWTALRRGDEVRELRPWLHRIVHNTALNALRTPGYDYDELRATLQGSGGPAELAERRAAVRGALAGLAALPERQREALLQIAVEGRSQDEVAEQLGLSHGAVRQLVHRARSALRGAATAVVPLPLATWLATAGAGRGDVAVRVGELVAGAGGSATLAKAGAVAVLAGGAVAAPAVVHDVSDRERRPVAEAPGQDRARAAPEPASPVRPEPVPVDQRREPGGEGAPPAAGDDSASGPGPGGDDGGSGRRGRDGRRRGGGGRHEAGDRRGGGTGTGGGESGRRGGGGTDAGGGESGPHGSGGGTDTGGGESGRRGRGDDDDEPEAAGDDDHSGPGGGGSHSGGEESPVRGGEDDDDDREEQSSSGGQGSGSGGSGSSGDDDGDDEEPQTAPAPQATPPSDDDEEDEDDDSSGSGSSDD